MVQSIQSKKQINRLLFAVVVLVGTFFQFNVFGQVGTPTYLNTTGTTPLNTFPLNSTTSNKIQWIYAPGAFTTLGGGGGTPAPGGNLITKVYIKFGTTINATNLYSDFTISLGQNVGAINNYPDVPATTGVSFNTGLTQCFYQASGFAFTGIVANAWYGITLQTPFAYDPSLALVMEVKVSSGTGNSVVNLATTGISQRLYAAFSATTGTANTGLTPTGFDMIPGSVCTDPPTAGASTAVPSSGLCIGSNFLLNLTGNSTGTNQTYQWQSSPTNSAPWTNVGGVQSSPGLNTTVTGTLYYQCEVICSGGAPQYSSSVLVTANPPFPGGTYTINSALPTGGSNYQTFTDAVAALNCGISGPVIFDVDPASGPYTEQVTIPVILGASSTNTVTFNGNGRTIQFTPVTANRHIIKLDGADYVTLRDLNIVGLATDFDWGVHLINGADNDSIVNCIINLNANTSTTQSNSACIVASASNTSVITTGSTASNLVVSGCTLQGGYTGVVLYGVSGGPSGTNNKIINNTIRDFYSVGVELNNNNGSLIKNNDINRANRVTVTTFEGVELGTGNRNVTVDGNRIHDTHTSASVLTGTAYGIYSTACDATVGNENRIINNLIYNFNSASGLIYALYNSSSDGVRYYHNTVVLDHAAATAGTTRGFFQTTLASNIELNNNLIYITRGGTGAKNCLYFGTTTSTIASNNNLLYMNAPAGTNGIGFYTTNRITLADWQAVNGSIYDQQSISIDPVFLSPGTNDYTPTSALVDNQGIPVGVLDDIDGATRDLTTPDLGAIEFTITAGIDVGAFAIVTPLSSQCYTNSETVTVRIKNFGTDPIDFSVDPVSITCNITGPIGTTLTGTPSGILPIAGTLDVILSGTADMSVMGNYSFDVYTDMVNDADQSNDTLATVVFNTTVVAGSINANTNSHCISGSSNLTLVGNTPGFIQWQESTTSASGPWTNVGTPIATYSTGTLTQTTYYRVILTCSGNIDSTQVDTITVNNPMLLGTTPGSICGTGSVALSASVSAGATANWYSTPTGGAPLASGPTFNTPIIGINTNYYVAASSGGGGVATVGAPNLSIGAFATWSSTAQWLNFTVLSPTTIQSVDMYFSSAIGTPFSIVIRDAGTLANVFTYNGTVSVTSTSVANIIPINATLNPGNYQMNIGAGSATTYRNSTGGVYPYTIPGVISITGNTFDPVYYYMFYRWQVGTGCETARTLVTATVNPGPTITAASVDAAVCSGGSTDINVSSSNDPNYEYTWSSIPAGFVASGPGPHNVSPTVSTQYIVNAVDTSTGTFAACIDADTINVLVVSSVIGGTVTSSEPYFCVSGTPTLTVTGSSGAIQWQESTVSGTGPWSDVGTGLPNYTPSLPITQTTYYRVMASCGVVLDSSNVDTVVVNSPTVLTTTGDSNCGPGVLTLSATGNGTGLNWYANPTGGAPIGTGNTFTTPLISNTTTYYAEASDGDLPSTGGRMTNVAGSVLSGFPRGIIFNATEAVTIDSVGMLCSGVASAVTVQLYNSGGTATISSPVVINIPANAGTSSVPVLLTFPVNFQIPAAGTYRLFVTSIVPTGNILWYESVGVTGYPYAVGSKVSITSSVTALTGAASLTTYYYFYKMVISSGCYGPRVPVVATISTPPAMTVSSLYAGVCGGDSTDISVISSNDPNYVYTWTSNPAGFSANGNGPYTVIPSGTTTYIVNALDTSSGVFGGCVNIDSVTVVYTPTLTPGTVSASDSSFCITGSPTITVSGASGAIQWQESTVSGTGPWSNVGINNSSTYLPGPITQTTYYRVLVSCSSTIDSSNVDSIMVNNPEILSTTPGSRCGVGTVDLQATASPGSTMNWYANSTGGTALGSNSTFTTPLLLATDTFYVAGSNGAFTGGLGLPNRVGATTNSGYSDIGLMFDAFQPFTLQSVAVYPVATTPSGNVTATIALKNAAGTILQSTTISIPTNVSPGVKTLVPLNFNVPTGTGHRLVFTSASGGGLTGFIREATTGFVYPYTLPGYASITSAYTGGASAIYYYYFYDWKISVGCEGPRIPVIATVTPAPAIGITASNDTICFGDSTNLSVGTGLADYTNFEWLNSSGSIIANGTNTWVSPTVNSKYYLFASGNINNCQALDSVTITVNDFPLTVGVNNPVICGAIDSAQITTVATGGTFTYLWTPSSGLSVDTIPNPKVRPVGTSQAYTLTVTNTVTGCSKTRSLTIYNSSPSILSTVTDTICGTDLVTLSATASTGAQIGWWSAPVGGTLLGTGPTFSSTISSNTNFYVEAKDTIPQTPLTTNYTGGIIATDPNAAGNMFDITALNNIRVTGFNVHLNNDTLAPSNISVYYKVGSYSGSVTNASAWTLLGSYTGLVSAGVGVPTYLPLNLDLQINAGQTYGIYIVVTNLGVSNSLRYSSGATSPAEFAVAASDFNLQVKSGTICFGPFTGQVAAPVNRLWNGSVLYSIGCSSARSTVAAVSLTPPAISLTATEDTVCLGSSTVLQASSINDPNYTYVWNPGNLSGPSHTVAPLVKTTYVVTATDTTIGASAGCIAIDSVIINVVPIPLIDATPTSVSVCGGGTANLSVTNLTPAETTFGTQANQNTSTTYPAPYSVYYGAQRMQMLITAAELSAAGYNAGSPLAGIKFPVVSLGPNWGVSLTSCNSFQMSIGNTALTTLTAFQTGLTQVIAPGNFTPAVGYGNTHTFNTPFVWNGTSNIIIETTFGNNIAGVANDHVIQYNTGTSYQSTIVYRADNVTAAAAAVATTVSLSFSARPDFKFVSNTALTYQWSPVTGLNNPTSAAPVLTVPPV
jgi:hypothetical protein